MDWRDDPDPGGRLAANPATSVRSALPRRIAVPAWYDVSWNPIAGCSSAGPGCEHCDAIRIVERLGRMAGRSGARYAGLTRPGRSGAEWSGELRVRDDLLGWPLVQRKPRRILVGSLSDLFHEALAIETIDAVHAVMRLAHWHRFVLQTRRAQRMRAYYTDPETPLRIAEHTERLTAGAGGLQGSSRGAPISPTQPGAGQSGAWPLPNLLLGVSVEDQPHAERVGELLQTPAALRWACFEPLLGPVRADRILMGEAGYIDALSGRRFEIDQNGQRQVEAALPRLDWIVAGGETGPASRPTVANWVRDLRDGCIAAGVRFFFKQWGEWGPGPGNGSGEKAVRYGRRTAGRLIDGRSWDQLPPALRVHPARRRAAS